MAFEYLPQVLKFEYLSTDSTYCTQIEFEYLLCSKADHCHTDYDLRICKILNILIFKNARIINYKYLSREMYMVVFNSGDSRTGIQVGPKVMFDDQKNKKNNKV